MKVVRVDEFGGPDVLAPVEVGDPVAGAGEVVVQVSAVDVIHLDTQIRAGRMRDYLPVRPPYVPGGGVAGLVLSVGAGVSGDWVGRTVAARTTAAYAERVVVVADALVPVPDAVGVRAAAALLHDGPTALALADKAAIKAGERVLVTAAAGGLGLLLVQLAKAEGALVVAAARGERKAAVLRELGADAVVDYTEPDWPDRVLAATGGHGADVVFDGAGGPIGVAAFGVTAVGGRFSAHGAPAGGFAPLDRAAVARRNVLVRGIEQVQFDPERARSLLERAVADGVLTPVIGQTFPLVKAADAHAAVESRDVVGKTLLLP